MRQEKWATNAFDKARQGVYKCKSKKQDSRVRGITKYPSNELKGVEV